MTEVPEKVLDKVQWAMEVLGGVGYLGEIAEISALPPHIVALALKELEDRGVIDGPGE